MNENLIPFQPAAPARPNAAIYTAPDDVVGDLSLTTADKRALLASWVSDARAVENAPKLRRLDSGAVVEVETILDALRALDRSVGVVVRLPVRATRSGDPDDDGPPPTPARAGMPPQPIHVDAYGARRRLVGEAV
jgi:hypothetical protein